MEGQIMDKTYSKNYSKVKNFYDKGLWDDARVRNAVTKPSPAPWITKEEYQEITGEAYE
jgi:hypothetical protein